MEQEDKVSAAAASLATGAAAVARTTRADDGAEGAAAADNAAGLSRGGAVKPASGGMLDEPDDDVATPEPSSGSGPSKTPKKSNNVRRIRIERMLSKAELARRANLSVLTIDRVERGYGCRMDTKRKILEALGLSLADRVRVFGEEE